MRKVGYAAAAFAVVAVFFVALVPARALTRLTAGIDGLVLLGVGGAWWRGHAQVVYSGFEAGRFAWTLRPARLLVGELRVDWRLDHPSHNLTGSARRGFGGDELVVAGTIDATSVNPFLAPYDIALGGTFDVADVRLQLGQTLAAGGDARWTGGRTVYRLSGRTYNVNMPAMYGRLGVAARTDEHGEASKELLLDAFDDDGTVLVSARLAADGWLHIGVTRRFTALAGNPWPGTSADDVVVVTVAEQVF